MAEGSLKVKINSASMGSVKVGGHDVSAHVKGVHLIAVAGKVPSVFLELMPPYCDIECEGAEIRTNQVRESAVEKADRLLDELLADINAKLDRDLETLKSEIEPIDYSYCGAFDMPSIEWSGFQALQESLRHGLMTPNEAHEYYRWRDFDEEKDGTEYECIQTEK